MVETSIELTITSAKDLYNVNLIAKMAVYAVVYIDGNGKQDQKHKTHVDKDGDSNPTWNYPMKFTIDESVALQNRLTLVVKIKSIGMFGDKDVGEVHVPVKELLDGDYAGRRPLQFVTYQVRKPSGNPKGELSFSYKFEGKSGGKFDNYADKLDEPVMAYPTVGFGFSSVYPPLYTAPVGAALGSYPSAPTVADSGSYLYPPDGSAHYPPYPNKVDKLDEPVTAYPAAGSEFNSVYQPLNVAPVGAALESYPPAPTVATLGTYPPTGDVYYPPPVGYPEQQVGYMYQQKPAYGSYPPPPALGYGVYPPQLGHGYPSVQLAQPPQKNNKLGFGLGAGLLGGALGGMLIGDIVSDAASGGF